jgi:hypothetical protein
MFHGWVRGPQLNSRGHISIFQGYRALILTAGLAQEQRRATRASTLTTAPLDCF